MVTRMILPTVMVCLNIYSTATSKISKNLDTLGNIAHTQRKLVFSNETLSNHIQDVSELSKVVEKILNLRNLTLWLW